MSRGILIAMVTFFTLALASMLVALSVFAGGGDLWAVMAFSFGALALKAASDVARRPEGRGR